jgi:hypothetical protein
VISQKSGARSATGTERPETKNERARIVRLVREEFSTKIVSYAVTAAAAIFFGLVIVPAFASAVAPLEAGERGDGRLVDFFFLAIVSILSINVFSRDYFLIHRDPFRGWLVFLRSLPVSPREMVLARSLIMLPATLAMTVIFFAPITAFILSTDPRFGVGQFLWFVLAWLGYALAAGGMNLLMELGANGKLALFFQFAWLAVILGFVWMFGGDIVYSTFRLAGEYGPLTAGIALLFGGVLFALFAKVTERRVASREFVT